MKHSIVEMVGTFFLTLAVCLVSQPLGVGLMLAAMIYMGGHVSGGHYNPAVSLAMFLEGKLSLHCLMWYMGAQCTGSLLAATFYYLLSDSTFAPSPAQLTLSWEAIAIEMLLTFVFCAVIISVVRKTKASDDISLGGLIIGLTLTALIFTGGDISGAVLNPAIGFSTILFDSALGGESFNLFPIYLVGPFTGSIAAWYFHKCCTNK